MVYFKPIKTDGNDESKQKSQREKKCRKKLFELNTCNTINVCIFMYHAWSMSALHTWCWVCVSYICVRIWCLNQSCASIKRVHALRVCLYCVLLSSVYVLYFLPLAFSLSLSLSFTLHRIFFHKRSYECVYHERRIRTMSKRRRKKAAAMCLHENEE